MSNFICNNTQHWMIDFNLDISLFMLSRCKRGKIRNSAALFIIDHNNYEF